MSVDSRRYQSRLARVRRCRERLAPVVRAAVELDRPPGAIGRIQLRPRRDVSDVRSRDDRRTLNKTLQRDRASLQEHTRVAERPRHWERDHRGPDRLLRGSERIAAGQWRDAALGHAPPPGAPCST